VTLVLADEIDISRGDMLVRSDELPNNEREISANICWIGDDPRVARKKYIIKQTSNAVRAMVAAIEFKTDIHTLAHVEGDELAMNEIGRIRFKLQQPLFYDTYENNRLTGSFVVIDTFSNNTVGAGMIV